MGKLKIHHIFAVATIVASAVFATTAGAQNAAPRQLTVSPTADDEAAAREATAVRQHITLANTPEASAWAVREIPGRTTTGATAAASSAQQLLLYPADLINNGGNVVESAESHAIFMNPSGKCTVAACWGDPVGFLDDLGISDFIHVTDQYVGLSANQRYTAGASAMINFTPRKAPFTNRNMLAIVHAVAALTGQTGYGHVYHVFLPPRTDVCLTSSDKICYSPNHPKHFVFCAYHGSVTFSDIGHVLFSVEPFQNVRGCQVGPGTPNGQLVDSTDNTLSHELFETITDPDGDAWWNSANLSLFGEEIGDECIFLGPAGTPSFMIGNKNYAVQLEYANSQHACANQP